MPDSLVSYEGDPADVNAMEMAEQMEKSKMNVSEWDGLPLTSSQCSGNEWPCHQSLCLLQLKQSWRKMN